MTSSHLGCEELNQNRVWFSEPKLEQQLILFEEPDLELGSFQFQKYVKPRTGTFLIYF